MTVELLDIKDKFDSYESSLALEHVIKTLFKNITMKSGRSKRDWSKMTQIYSGIKWIRDIGVHSETEFIHIPSLLPPEFFAIAKNMKEIKLDILLEKINMEARQL